MSNTLLPGAFAQLESFATDWCIADEASRNRKRLASAMSAVRAFYKAALLFAQSLRKTGLALPKSFQPGTFVNARGCQPYKTIDELVHN